jgi:hypothetical protein
MRRVYDEDGETYELQPKITEDFHEMGKLFTLFLILGIVSMIIIYVK